MTEQNPSYLEELDVAVAAARKAGRMIREHAGGIDRQAVSMKGRHDLVTHVDVAAQRIIVGLLTEAFPDYAVLAEEEDGETEAPDEAREYCWIIDPIDGTTNFAHGMPPFAVSIGLRRGDEMVLGVVLDVPHGELFTAVRGGGLHVDGVPASVSSADTLDESLITTGFPYRVIDHLESYLAVLGSFMQRAEAVRRAGSAALDLAYVACGRSDGFFETGLSPWDVAAGLVLVEEGGGRVTDYRGAGDPVFARQVIASNGRVHEEIIDVVAPMKDVYA